MTSKEVAAWTRIHAASARLSELLRDGYVKIANGKRLNRTGKSVLIYRFMPESRAAP